MSFDSRQIVHCEASSNYCVVYLTSGKKMMLCKTLRHIQSLLPKKSFYRIHHSHLVMLDKIQSVEKTNVWLKNGDCVPIARSRRMDFRKMLSRMA